MTKWICTACGAEVNGKSRPKACPSCGAPKEKLEKDEI